MTIPKLRSPMIHPSMLDGPEWIKVTEACGLTLVEQEARQAPPCKASYEP